LQLSYSTYCPQVVSYGQPWSAGCYAPVMVPVRTYCPVAPVMVNPCGVVSPYPYRVYRNVGVPATYRAFRTTVANPVFPVRCR